MAAISDNMRGALLMMASLAGFTLNDTCIKLIDGQLPLFELLFLRGALATLLIWLLARRLGALTLRLGRRDWALLGGRAVAEMGASYFFIMALFNMPLANATALLQLMPLTVAVGAVVFFGEAMGWKRSLAIAVGFGGMLLIVRPGSEGFNAYSFHALAAVACFTARDLTTRGMTGRVASLTVALVSAVSVTVFGGVVALTQPWVTPTAGQAGLLTLSAVFILCGYLFGVMVMRVGEIGFVMPFRYSNLLWALILGVVVFGDWPDPLTLVGAAVIVGTGLFTFYRERQAGLRATAERRADAVGLDGER